MAEFKISKDESTDHEIRPTQDSQCRALGPNYLE
jgi:hypothetical protein